VGANEDDTDQQALRNDLFRRARDRFTSSSSVMLRTLAPHDLFYVDYRTDGNEIGLVSFCRKKIIGGILCGFLKVLY
jgi:hypothetical protein